MSWRVEVHHRTTYRYGGQVESSYNEARLTPVTGPRQTVLSSALEVSPRVTPFRYIDVFGTAVHAFDLHQPHDQLSVVGHSVTETAPASAATNRLSWEALRSDRVADHYYDFLALTPLVDMDDAMRDAIADLRNVEDPTGAAHAVFALVQDHLTYVSGATAVHTTACDAFANRMGVCQDFVHISLALLRTMGIPARYVSGYVHNRPDAMLGETVRGESHAWVDVWTGDWWSFDPTGSISVGERHVVVATGRDYKDVAPLKGVFAGAALDKLEVGVDLIRRA
ncbi:MAG TPA: transglutaminase family protein [Acidimicrobiales bacterium]|nr:transglutaminase family protein [Acidimicrobiales bacterium]